VYSISRVVVSVTAGMKSAAGLDNDKEWIVVDRTNPIGISTLHA
jgi:hypothetical protein